MKTLSDTGFGRMAIIEKYGTKRIPEWTTFCKTLTRTTDLFLMATLVRAVFDMVVEPERYRSNHAHRPNLVRHSVERDALCAFKSSLLSRKQWMLKTHATMVDDPPLFASLADKDLYNLICRTLDALDKELVVMTLRDIFIDQQYFLVGPHNGHHDGTRVICIAVVSELALKVRPVKRTGNDSGFDVFLSQLIPVDTLD